MVSCLRVLAALTEEGGLFPTPIWQLTIACNSSFRGSNLTNTAAALPEAEPMNSAMYGMKVRGGDESLLTKYRFLLVTVSQVNQCSSYCVYNTHIPLGLMCDTEMIPCTEGNVQELHTNGMSLLVRVQINLSSDKCYTSSYKELSLHESCRLRGFWNEVSVYILRDNVMLWCARNIGW